MVMGHREKMINGDEQDAFCKHCRRLYGPTAGVVKQAKQKFNRRIRREAKQQIRRESIEITCTTLPCLP